MITKMAVALMKKTLMNLMVSVFHFLAILSLSSTSLGMLFFRTRISHLLDTMIDLKVEHFAAAMLHRRYRHLKNAL